MEPKRSNDACSEKLTQKGASCQQSIRRTEKRDSVVWIVRGEAPARCIAAARTTASATSAAAAAAAFVMWVPLVTASPKKHENNRWVLYVLITRKLIMQPCRLGKILVAINWLD